MYKQELLNNSFILYSEYLAEYLYARFNFEKFSNFLIVQLILHYICFPSEPQFVFPLYLIFRDLL
jgi:hypothetical protein